MNARRDVIEKLVQAASLIGKALPADEDGLRRALTPGGWSPAEHALHCALVCEVTAEAFRRALENLPLPRPPAEPLKSLARRFVLSTWRIPRGAEAPERVRPLVILPRAALLARLESARDEMVALDHLALRSRRELWVAHPALGPMSFVECVSFILIHARHHRRLILAGRS